MTQSLALSTLVVRDCDEAIGFYVGKLASSCTLTISTATVGG